MSEPRRIQMARQHPWRAENPDAVIVARPSKWGNPYDWRDIEPGVATRDPDTGEVSVYVTMGPETARELVVLMFTQRLAGTYGGQDATWTYPSIGEIRAALAGKDLACWCPLDQPCHADVLLEMANEATP